MVCPLYTNKISAFGLNSPSHRQHPPGLMKPLISTWYFLSLYGPFLSSRAFFIVVHSTSDSLVDLFVSLFLPEKAENDFGGNRTPDFFCSFIKDKPLSHSVSCSFIKDKPLSYSVSADSVVYPLQPNKRSPGFDSHQVVFPLFLGERGNISGENHGERTLDQGSEVECTTIKERTTGRKRTI